MPSETNMNWNLSEANKRETKRIPAGHNLSPNYTTLEQGFDVLGTGQDRAIRADKPSSNSNTKRRLICFNNIQISFRFSTYQKMHAVKFYPILGPCHNHPSQKLKS